VLRADPAECLLHDAVLAELDKSSGGKTLWRVAESAAVADAVLPTAA